MVLTSIIVFLLGDFLPAEVSGLSRIAEHGDDRFFVDTGQKAIYKLNPNGHFQTYDKQGPAPWELLNPERLQIFNGMVYVVDWVKRSIFVFDDQLNHLNTYRTPFMCRDILVVEQNIFIVGWDPETNTMIQKMTADFQHIKGFAEGLQDHRLLGQQVGRLSSNGKHLFFQHVFLPYWEVYDFNGNKLARNLFPGYSEQPLVSFDHLLGKGRSSPEMFLDQAIKGNLLLTVKSDPNNYKSWLYTTDLVTKQVSKRPFPYASLILSQQGHAFQVVDRQDEPLQLLAVQ